MKTEDHQERFGEIAQEKGYITWSQLREALEIQIEETIEKGEVRFIGQILYDLEFLTKMELQDVIASLDLPE
jgi:hypothetical protein